VLEKLIIQRALRVPASTGMAGDGTSVARQLDAALLDVGFSASRALLGHIGSLAPEPAMDLAATVVSAVRELVGDHIRHNAYFIGFPDDVPDTVEFWIDRLRAAVLTGGGTATDAQLRAAVASGGVLVDRVVLGGTGRWSWPSRSARPRPTGSDRTSGRAAVRSPASWCRSRRTVPDR